MRNHHCKAIVFSVLVLSVLPLCAGCPSSREPEKKGCLAGWVRDTEGNMLPLVKATLDGAETTYSDGHGLFTFEDLTGGTSRVVTLSLDGFVPASREVDIVGGETVSMDFVLTRREDAGTLGDPAASGEVSDGSGNKLTVPGGALSGAGKDGSGVSIQITAVVTAGLANLLAAPGSFQGVIPQTGATVQLEAYAMAHFFASAGGQGLSLSGGATAQIQIALPAGTTLQEGDQPLMWWFDVSAGVWVQSGQGSVQFVSGVGLVVVADIDTLGWWCCACPIESAHCLSGRVVDSSAGPVYGALVRACGLDYCGLTFARTASDGTYCLPVKRNSTVRLEAVPPGGLLVADSLDVSVPDTAASCGSGNCMQVNDLVVAFDSCVSGHVTEPDGTPIDGAEVFTSGGGHAVTGADGAFCMRVPGNVWLAVYVVGRPPKAVLTPAAATCEAGNCAEVELCVDYPEDGDVVGFIFSNLDTVEHLVLPDEKNHTSTAMFFSGYEGEQFDLYETGSVIDSCEVFTPVLSLDFSLALYIGAAWNSQLAFQLLFDLDFALNAPFLNDLVPDGEVFGALDPGSPATLTDGTDTIDMLRPLDYYYELFGDGYWDTLGYAYLEPWMGGWFVQSPAVSSAFDNGDVLTYTWPGGVDIGAFSVTGQIPGRLNFTAPATLNGILDAEPLADLTLQWDATTPGDLVTIVLETVVLDTAKSSLEFGVVVCRVADDGEYTIPAATLAQLPAADGLFAVRTNFLLAVRHEIVKQPVPLPRAGGTGYVVLFSSPEPTMACSFDASFGL